MFQQVIATLVNCLISKGIFRKFCLKANLGDIYLEICRFIPISITSLKVFILVQFSTGADSKKKAEHCTDQQDYYTPYVCLSLASS